MAFDNRPDVADYIAWGNLIKKWARDKDSRPATLDDLLAQCNAAGVGMMMPPHIKDIHVVQKDKDIFVLRLPPADLIAESEEALKAGGPYPIPPFYNQRYHKMLDVPKAEMLDFHAQRTGDYVIRLCI